ncbi:AAA family ATPase [Actinoplanes sp. NPDC049668]|uniref:AAA family ATPase n=1 Tax=unclassified Actinoplanes TaxID=2626549 RepID=UPI0033B0C29F
MKVWECQHHAMPRTVFVGSKCETCDRSQSEAQVDYLEAADDASVHLDQGAPDRTRRSSEESRPARVVLTKASSIAMRGVKWLYRGRIPHGMVTLLAGREGIGKSTVWADLAARLTRGVLPGRFEGRPQNVIVCATEDSWSHTIVPRLLAASADMDLVLHIAVHDEDGKERGIVAPQDIRRMQEAFRTVRPALLVIDPLMAVIDGKIDTHKQAEVQQALEPLVKLCERIGMAVLALIHVNKSGGTDPLNNIMGSKAFATLPRSVLYCLEEDDGQFMFCHVKCNVGPKMPSIGYRLTSVRFDLPPEEVEAGDEPYIETGRIVWGDEDTRSASEMLEAKASNSKLGGPAQAVIALLEAVGGTLSTAEINAKLTPAHTEAAIRNALSRLTNSSKIDSPMRGYYQALSSR